MSCSILIPCYLRPAYLWQQLATIHRQNLAGLHYEIVVLNDGLDDGTYEVAAHWKSAGLNVRYLFTGQRNASGAMKHRVPGFALNIGIQQSSADIIVLSCVEIYHLNDSVRTIVEACEADPIALGTAEYVFDDDGTLWNCLGAPIPAVIDRAMEKMVHAYEIRRETADPFISNPYMTYFLAVRRELLLDIGGYDEDFTGTGVEDNDLVDRLSKYGCHYVLTKARVVHLFHQNVRNADIFSNPAYLHNLRLYRQRREIVVRNVGRQWGVLI